MAPGLNGLIDCFSLINCRSPNYDVCRSQQIDGRAFLLLTQQDIVRILSIKLGPALKIYNSILMFRLAESKSVARGVDP